MTAIPGIKIRKDKIDINPLIQISFWEFCNSPKNGKNSWKKHL